MKILKNIFLLGFCTVIFLAVASQEKTLKDERAWPSQELASTAMQLWKDSFSLDNKPAKWTYDMGVVLKGIEGVWNTTGDGKYFKYIQQQIDFFVDKDGNIKTYKQDEFNLDNVNNGRILLLLYKVTGNNKYWKAATQLREQLRNHPRTSEGGFWHKKIYPYQMWLDGLYMAEPFYAEYAAAAHEDTAFNDIARQFILMEKHSRDEKTGLLYHGWDESKQQKWADAVTGRSPNFWGRAMGWYGMALVDVLDYFPANHPQRKKLIGILNRYVTAVAKWQDAKTGLWWDVLNFPNKEKNYLEASASSMFVYTIAKAVRMGYVSAAQLSIAKKGYQGIVNNFIKRGDAHFDFNGTVKVSGLGGNPYRDGSYAYYVGEPVIANDPKGMGAFIQAANEMEKLPTLNYGKGKTILLDRYFNSEQRKDVGGRNSYWHYVWEEKSNAGFSTFGNIFERYGAKLSSLDVAPSKINLKNASVYIIVDPDHVKDNPNPNYVTSEDTKVISDWVRAGGVLVLMANDSANCELKNFNHLAGTFGIMFTDKSINMVKNDVFEQGAVIPGNNNPIFKTAKKLYLKEISALAIHLPKNMNPVTIMKGEDIVIATAKFGKGVVFAVGDPWLYNEYVDGRKLPLEYENYKAAEDLVKWLIKQSK